MSLKSDVLEHMSDGIERTTYEVMAKFNTDARTTSSTLCALCREGKLVKRDGLAPGTEHTVINYYRLNKEGA